MDYNTGLTQVLDDGTNTYLYGNGRLAQVNNTTQYFLDDALGSVRQMVNTGSSLTLARSYDPYGVVRSNAQLAPNTAYGFTGEYTEATGDIYLRARHYSPSMGRFISRDIWPGNFHQPMSYNRWNYTESNPVNNIDPTGYISESQGPRADTITANLYAKYNVLIIKDWGYNIPQFMTLTDIGYRLGWLEPAPGCTWWEEGYWRSIHEMESFAEGVKALAQSMGGAGKFKSAMKNFPVLIRRYSEAGDLSGTSFAALAAERNLGAYTVGDVIFFDGTFSSDEFASAVTVHELAHAWDARNEYKIGWELATLTNTLSMQCKFGICSLTWDPSNPVEMLPTEYAEENEKEYWAEAVMTYVFPNRGNLGPITKKYVEDRIKGIP